MRSVAVVVTVCALVSCAHEPAKSEAAPAQEAVPASANPNASANAVAKANSGDVAAPAPTLPASPGLPKPPLFLEGVEAPADNALTADKVDLGRALFFNPKLSKDGSMSCESCHHPAQAWTSGKVTDAKVGGKMNGRNAPTMTNLGLHQNGYYWDGRKATLEAVTEAAWTGQLGADPVAVTAALNADPVTKALFVRAFGSEANPKNVPQALASFLRALQSGNAPYDLFEKGDANAVTAEVKHGGEVFKEVGCSLCHAPPLYSDTQFHDVGIGWDEKAKAFKDHGRMDASKKPEDDGKFKTPSLRDVEKTAPYFHDGSAATLEEAVDHMLAGGIANPGLDAKLHPHKLSAADRAALIAFLKSLTGKATLDGI